MINLEWMRPFLVVLAFSDLRLLNKLLRTHTKQVWALHFLLGAMRFIDCLWADSKVIYREWVRRFLVVLAFSDLRLQKLTFKN